MHTIHDQFSFNLFVSDVFVVHKKNYISIFSNFITIKENDLLIVFVQI